MKKSPVIIAAICLMVATVACKKEETPTPDVAVNNNVLVVDGEEQTIDYVEVIDNESSENGIHEMELYIETVFNNEDKYSSVNFELFTSEAGTIPDGKYTYFREGEEIRVNTFEFGDLAYNMDSEFETEREGDIMEGEINVENTGSNSFKITFSGVAYEDSLIFGSSESVYLDTLVFSGSFEGTYLTSTL